jgi:hypothetical protein
MAALTQVRGGEGEPPQGRALKSQLPEFLRVLAAIGKIVD